MNAEKRARVGEVVEEIWDSPGLTGILLVALLVAGAGKVAFVPFERMAEWGGVWGMPQTGLYLIVYAGFGVAGFAFGVLELCTCIVPGFVSLQELPPDKDKKTWESLVEARCFVPLELLPDDPPEQAAAVAALKRLGWKL